MSGIFKSRIISAVEDKESRPMASRPLAASSNATFASVLRDDTTIRRMVVESSTMRILRMGLDFQDTEHPSMLQWGLS